MPATLSIITNVFPREERGKAIGIWAGMAAIGIGLGPLIGGLLLEWFAWKSVFLVNVPVAAVALARGRRARARQPRPAARRLRRRRRRALDRGLVSLVYGVIEAPERGWTSPLILGCFARRRSARRGVRALGAAHPRPDAQPRVLPQPTLQRRLRRDQLRVLRALRRDLRAHAVPAGRARLLGARGRAPRWCRSRPAWSSAPARASSRWRASAPPGSSAPACWPRRPARLDASSGTADMSYWPLGLWFFGARPSIGWIMGPATESVMGAVPEEKAGVASAMNDVTRQVAGALGIAVIGSLVSSLYATRVEDATGALPAERPRRRPSPSAPRSPSPTVCPAAPGRHSSTPPRPPTPTRSASASSPPPWWHSGAACRLAPPACAPPARQNRCGRRRRAAAAKGAAIPSV